MFLMPNYSFQSSGMRRKQNFEIVFFRESFAALSSFTFCFLPSPLLLLFFPPVFSFVTSQVVQGTWLKKGGYGQFRGNLVPKCWSKVTRTVRTRLPPSWVTDMRVRTPSCVCVRRVNVACALRCTCEPALSHCTQCSYLRAVTV